MIWAAVNSLQIKIMLLLLLLETVVLEQIIAISEEILGISQQNGLKEEKSSYSELTNERYRNFGQ